MKTLKNTPLQLLLASSLTALVACGGGSGDGSTGGTDGSNDSTGSFNLAVTDAAIDSASHVFVEFTGVSIQPVDGEVIEFTFDEAKQIDLLALQGSASEGLVSGEEVPTGDYEWIRLHVNAEADGMVDSYIEMDDGNQMELWIPSGSQTGLKLVNGFTVTANNSVDFTIDFDLRKSVVLPPADQIGGAILKPALRLIDNTASGNISGSVDGTLLSEQCADPATQTGAVYVYSGADATVSDVRGTEGDPITTALVSETDGGYGYEVGFLDEGDYTLAYTCGASDDDPEAEDSLTFVGTTNATVEADATTEVNFASDAEADTGTMSMDVTDGPVDSASKVVVQFDGVEIIGSGETESRLIAFDEPKTLDLLTLQGSNSADLFTNETLEAGSYEQVRLMVTAALDGEMDSYIEFEDGTQSELWIPSGDETGLKMNGPFMVEAGGSSEFVIDFDLRKSVIATGGDTPEQGDQADQGGQGTILRPTLRIVDESTATPLEGEVDAAEMADAECENGAAVYVFAGADATVGELGSDNEPLATANIEVTAEGDYEYEVGFLEPADYTVAVTCQADLDSPDSVDDIEFKQSASVTIEADVEAALDFNQQ